MKLRRLRKALHLSQRDFAKLIHYPINKYGLLEQGRLDDLKLDYIDTFTLPVIWNVVKATRVNPYWMANDDVESIYEALPELTATTFRNAAFGSERGMFATDELIEEWRRNHAVIYGTSWCI